MKEQPTKEETELNSMQDSLADEGLLIEDSRKGLKIHLVSAKENMLSLIRHAITIRNNFFKS